MSVQTTLLTSHKGVDLHAATARRVMNRRLEGGDRLAALYRCELHTFWGDPPGVTLPQLLDTGRYYNPNKHHYGHFVLAPAAPWTEPGDRLTPAWPGDVRGTDLTGFAGDAAGLYARLLGGAVPAGHTAVDVVSWPRDADGPLLSGVLWRLVLAADPEAAAALGDGLAVARGRKNGLLVNPHMERWLTLVR